MPDRSKSRNVSLWIAVKVIVILNKSIFGCLLERKKRFEVDELISDIPELSKISDYYTDLSLPVPTKENRHAALSQRLNAKRSVGNAIASSVNNNPYKNAILESARTKANIRAQSNPRGHHRSLFDV